MQNVTCAATWLVQNYGQQCAFDGNATVQPSNVTLSDECKVLPGRVGSDGSEPIEVLNSTATFLSSPTTSIPSQLERIKTPAPAKSHILSISANVGVGIGIVAFILHFPCN